MRVTLPDVPATDRSLAPDLQDPATDDALVANSARCTWVSRPSAKPRPAPRGARRCLMDAPFEPTYGRRARVGSGEGDRASR